jgi:hypothetical protein
VYASCEGEGVKKGDAVKIEKIDKRDGALRISDERIRQIEKEGWSAEHDDAHEDFELAWAAVCYAAPDLVFLQDRELANVIYLRDPWPFETKWDKRQYDGNVVLGNWKQDTAKRIRQLEMAGAFIAAEIDRLLRAYPPAEEER